jgi:uncharacterized protein DUF4154
MTCHRRHGLRVAAANVLVIVALAVHPTLASAASRDVSEVAVKAAFLYNFAKFAGWPALKSGVTIVLCVVGDDDVADALGQIVRGHTIDGHALAVTRPEDATTWRSCHLLFIVATEARRLAGGLAGLRSLPVLTVSDGKDFAKAGGIIELYADDERMRFDINVDASRRAGLPMSSRLLALATIVRDAAK